MSQQPNEEQPQAGEDFLQEAAVRQPLVVEERTCRSHAEESKTKELYYRWKEARAHQKTQKEYSSNLPDPPRTSVSLQQGLRRTAEEREAKACSNGGQSKRGTIPPRTPVRLQHGLALRCTTEEREVKTAACSNGGQAKRRTIPPRTSAPLRRGLRRTAEEREAKAAALRGLQKNHNTRGQGASPGEEEEGPQGASFHMEVTPLRGNLSRPATVQRIGSVPKQWGVQRCKKEQASNPDDEFERALQLSLAESQQAARNQSDKEDKLMKVLLHMWQLEEEKRKREQQLQMSLSEEEELLRVLALSQKEAADQDKERETMELVLFLSRQETGDGGRY